MENRIIARMKKQANSYDQMSQKISETLDSILEDMLREKAEEIGFPYDGGAFDLVSQDPEYQKLGMEISNIIDGLSSIVQNWGEETAENYPDKLE